MSSAACLDSTVFITRLGDFQRDINGNCIPWVGLEEKARKLLWEQGREARAADREARRIALIIPKKKRLEMQALDVSLGL
jgi:hypothetical protein